MTGLSGAGKSTIADAVVEELRLQGVQAARLDGDDLRLGLNSDLGFSPESRRRTCAGRPTWPSCLPGLATLRFARLSLPPMRTAAYVRNSGFSVYRGIREDQRLAECENRDPKGLYKKARRGEIKQFTGITSVFEEPENPDVVIETEAHTVEECARQLVREIYEKRQGAVNREPC